MSKYKRAGLVFVFLWFFGGGIGHFVVTDFFVGIVPPYIPWPLAAVYVSGVFELLGAFGLIPRATRPWAGAGLLLLILCVSPANIYMWQHPELFPKFPPALLGVRLVIQALLIVVVWWSTRVPRGPAPLAARQV
ncbi:MAG: DoxX family multipass rane protein [Nevskia sp.]|nr:DoxX family multipass rane protein [Nevskia sp.]